MSGARQGDTPLLGAWVGQTGSGQRFAVLAPASDLWQVFADRAGAYAVAVLVLMLALLAASQLLIRFILTHLHTLKDVMLHVEKSGDLSARVPLQGRDEVGQMASAFNAMQAGYQRIVGTVAAAATKLDEGAQALARSMGQVRQACSASRARPTRPPPRSTRCPPRSSISPSTPPTPVTSRRKPTAWPAPASRR